MRSHNDFAKLSNNSFDPLIRNPLIFGTMTAGNNFVPIPPPTAWALFNGTATVPYSAIASNYYTGNGETIVTLPMSDTKFFMIYGGTFGTCYCVVGTYGTPGSQPTFGTPVQLDTVQPSGNIVIFDAVQVDAFDVIYIDYSDFTAGNQFGVVATTSGDTITLHTSIPISTNSAPNYPGNGIAYFNPTTVITTYFDESSSQMYVVSITITDTTLTLNSPRALPDEYMWESCGSLGIACTTDGYCVITLYNQNVPEWDAISLPVTGGGTTIGSIQSTITLSSGAADRFCAMVNTSGFQFLSGITIDGNGTEYHVVAFKCQNGNFTLGSEQVIYIDENFGAFPIGFVNINNTNNQTLFIFDVTNNVPMTSQLISCITPNNNNFTYSFPLPVNANNITRSNATICKPAVLTDEIIIYPGLPFDGQNYGLSVLQIPNTQVIPYNVFTLQVGAGEQTTGLSSSLGNGTGTINTHTIVISSSNDYSSFLIPGGYISINSDQYTVASATFLSNITTVTTVEELSANYVSIPCYVFLLSSITSTTSDISFTQSDASMQPYIGTANGLPTLCFYGNYNGGTDSQLNTTIPFPIGFNATLFVVVQATDDSNYLVNGIKDANLPYLLDIQSATAQIDNGNVTIGSYAINSGLTLITLVRDSLGTSTCYVNGVFNASISTYVVALGNDLNFVIGTRPDGAVPLSGNISYVELWDGALDDATIATKNAEIMSIYGIV